MVTRLPFPKSEGFKKSDVLKLKMEFRFKDAWILSEDQKSYWLTFNERKAMKYIK